MRRIPRIVFTVILAALATPLVPHAETPSPRVAALVPGVTVERELSTGASHRYTLPLRAGDFVHVTIVQRGIDISATLTRPDGRDLLSVNACDDLFCPETIAAIADADGPFTLTIRPVASTTRHGHYAVRLEAAGPPSPADLIRVDAERARERARVLQVSNAGLPDALVAFNSAVAGYRQLHDRASEMRTLLEISRVEYRAAKMTDALEAANRARDIAQELGDRATVAVALRRAGVLIEWSGDLNGARELFEQSAAISHETADAKNEAAALNDLGILAGRSGDSELAIRRFEQALPLARASGATLDVNLELNNLGIAYENLGQYDKALSVMRQALASHRAANEVQREITVLNNIGNVEHWLGRDRQSLETHLTALALARTSGGKEDLARSLNTVGDAYVALGEPAKALEYIREGLAIRRDIGDLLGEDASLDAQGRALHLAGDNEHAEEQLREALALEGRIHDDPGTLRTLRTLSEVERDAGRRADAIRDIRSAVELEETIRQRITSPGLRASFRSVESDKYELLIDLLQQPAGDASATDVAAAFEVSERARARVLLETLFDARVDVREGVDPALREREQRLQKQLSDASGRLTRAVVSKSPNAAAAARTVDDLTAEYEQLETEVRRTSPRYAALTQPKPLTTADVQRSVVDDQTVLLEFMLGEKRSWLWAVTPGTIDAFALPPRKAIEADARALYAAFTARQRRPGGGAADMNRIAAADAKLRTEAAIVSRMLFGGIADRLNGEWRNRRLAIVGAGALEYLPFGALPAPSPSGARATAGPEPLIAQHDIVMIPSASVVSVLRDETAQRRPASRTLAIVADPVFDASDPRVRRAGIVRTAAQLRPARVRAGPGRLPFSREEADAIAAFANRDGVFEATGFDATRALALGGTLAGYRIVHFATHGVVDAAQPALSGLVLSLVDEHGVPRDGYLRLHDIYNLRLDADLVVLSACQTALGKQIKGEGLVGLARAFMYAGTPRVVASLWEVDDLATAELMKHFYRALLRDHLQPAAALARAQRELARDPRWSSPYYWAGFVIEGDWK